MKQDGAQAGRVAIIGAGWSGLQCAQGLKEKGVHVDIFEKNSEIGGTWSPELSYSHLTLHSTRWVNQMTVDKGKFLPFPGGKASDMEGKAPAAEMFQYLKDFVDKTGLQSSVHCGTFVKEVHYDSDSQVAHLAVEKDSVSRREGPYNYVIFASMSGWPSMPDIPDRGFKGKLLHSSQLKEKMVSEIIDSKASVLVLGAGKSACDMIQAFQIAGYENVTWLCRETYWFWRHAAMFHDRSILGMLRAVGCLLFFLCGLVSPSFCIFGLWLIGYIILPGSAGWPKHFNAAKFHFGVLCDRQLSLIKKVKQVIGDPDHFCKNGVVLKSGEMIDCDVIICATGYDTGFAALRCYKDGNAISIKDCPLYEHAIVPHFPCLISATTAFYHFGPIRGVTLAEYVAYCLQRGSVSEETMQEAASGNLCKQTSTTCIIYTSKTILVRQWILLFIDLWRAGLISLAAFLEIGIALWVMGVYKPLRLKVGS